ncbi:MAG TPA: FtsX-like permease family protein, partial [Balneolaceae bacterium]|nr:FtsX-like permease family protein [Balneolaceae bacterium]
KKVDGIWVENQYQSVILPENLPDLRKRLGGEAILQLKMTGSEMIELSSSKARTAAYFTAMLADTIPVSSAEIWKGDRIFKDTKLKDGYSSIISYSLARQLMADHTEQLIGAVLMMHGVNYQIIAITKEGEQQGNWMLIPLTSFANEALKARQPQLIAVAPKIEMVDSYKAKIKDWLSDNFEDAEHSFRVVTNEMRLKQANQGMLLFKIIMGLITGISVIVGGIGIMNVLLISVTERTSEIGIRKATGAKKGDIILQFLSESVTVSVFGSFLGVLLGAGVALLSVPVVKYFIDVPFQTSFTVETLILISFLAVFIGIVFGTYPAVRAAKLTPVEAIRRE